MSRNLPKIESLVLKAVETVPVTFSIKGSNGIWASGKAEIYLETEIKHGFEEQDLRPHRGSKN